MTKEVLRYAWLPKKVENKWIWLKPYWSLIATEPYRATSVFGTEDPYTVWITLEVGRRNF